MSGLLTTGPGLATVEVYADVEATDGDGNEVRRPGDVAERVVGRWQYDAATEDTSGGQVVGTAASFRCRTFPAGFAGRVTYDGRDWDVIGEPVRAGLSGATRHVTVRLRARAPRPL